MREAAAAPAAAAAVAVFVVKLSRRFTVKFNSALIELLFQTCFLQLHQHHLTTLE